MSRFTNPVPQFFLDDGTIASSGRMYFYENKNYAALKATYSKPDNTVANTNPLILDGQGRIPACFGEGLYSVKFYAANPENPSADGALQWTRDDVSLSELTGQWELWNAAETYEINDIVKDPTDGGYYKLWGASTSKGEQPSLTLEKWEQIAFLSFYNANRTYSLNETVIYLGKLYSSLADGNVTAPPSVNWEFLSLDADQGSYLPVIYGTTAHGVATYTTQEGQWRRIGSVLFFTIRLGWSAHTGTGGIAITLPSPAASGAYISTSVGDVSDLSIPAGTQLSATSFGLESIRLVAIDLSGGSSLPVPVDSSTVSLDINGFYFV